jgi:hypothetical protein
MLGLLNTFPSHKLIKNYTQYRPAQLDPNAISYTFEIHFYLYVTENGEGLSMVEGYLYMERLTN